jgi:hypothetical protein
MNRSVMVYFLELTSNSRVRTNDLYICDPFLNTKEAVVVRILAFDSANPTTFEFTATTAAL